MKTSLLVTSILRGQREEAKSTQDTEKEPSKVGGIWGGGDPGPLEAKWKQCFRKERMNNYTWKVQCDKDWEQTIEFISLEVTGFVHKSNFGEIGGRKADRRENEGERLR